MQTVPSARHINPDAGDHDVPEDPRELEAAVRAGERSLEAFPYYELRYGARGARFASSDSAWLAVAARGGQAELDRQVLWLGRVLSSRGMPQWLMERHLEFMRDELRAAVPERAAEYETLGAAAAMLHRLRAQHIADAEFDALAREFDAAVGEEWARKLSGMGEILVSATVDVRLGIPNAAEQMESWIVEQSQLPFPWRDAALRTLRRARDVVR